MLDAWKYALRSALDKGIVQCALSERPASSSHDPKLRWDFRNKAAMSTFVVGVLVGRLRRSLCTGILPVIFKIVEQAIRRQLY